MYLRMTLFLFKALYIHLIYPSVESDATDGLIYTFIADRNNNDSTKNTWKWPSSVDNYSMICILLEF